MLIPHNEVKLGAIYSLDEQYRSAGKAINLIKIKRIVNDGFDYLEYVHLNKNLKPLTRVFMLWPYIGQSYLHGSGYPLLPAKIPEGVKKLEIKIKDLLK
jgi:hypothetical protein